MNKNIDLTKILEDCPRGFELYSSIYGTVTFEGIDYNNSDYPICVKIPTPTLTATFTKKGRYFFTCSDSECCLFPSREQRDWSKFIAPWYKKERFDPKTLKEFDKVLVKEDGNCIWRVDIISVPANYNDNIPYLIGDNDFDWIIPYNEETKHLIGTKDEAPEFYKYWED